jgi:dihydrofolate synthase/folylpolyglutamate synthase
MNREKIIASLFKRHSLGMKFDIDRMRQAAVAWGNPQNAFRSFHVAGTNGKGSVCAFLESILRFQGFSTGLFTSPHIVRFEERFIINGSPVATGDWLDVYSKYRAVAKRYNLTFFEISTFIAFELFKRKKVDWAVVEVGLGGRLDATNILQPDAAIIASIGLDHTELLGDTVGMIAKEKLGIVKEGIPVIIADSNCPEVLKTAQVICADRHAQLYMAGKKDTVDCFMDHDTGYFTYKNIRFHVRLAGTQQITNALCAIKAAEALGVIHDYDTLVQSVADTFIPARCQIVPIQGKTVVFDVAHNPQAAGVLVETLAKTFPGIPQCIVCGIMADKDIEGIIKALISTAAMLILTKPDVTRAATTETIVSKVSPGFKGTVVLRESVGDAVAYALHSWDGVICITGSFYTVGEAMVALGIDPYRGRR